MKRLVTVFTDDKHTGAIDPDIDRMRRESDGIAETVFHQPGITSRGRRSSDLSGLLNHYGIIPCLRLFFLLLLLCSAPPVADAGSHAVARGAAPVLNSAGFRKVFGGRDGKTLKTDICGQVREMEFIALPGTVFRVVGELRSGKETVYRVETDEYPAAAGTFLYLDKRFVQLLPEAPSARKRNLPPREAIIAAMKTAGGSPYVWGGNLRQGVDALFNYYYEGSFSGQEKQRLGLAGLDCSGLLYEATGGWTPRNTSSLVGFGDSVAVSGKSAAAISAVLEPLDLIVWNGHVLIVLDSETVIESRLLCGRPGNGGVIISPLRKRLAGIMMTRKPADVWPSDKNRRDAFVVRRWYPM